MTLLAEEMRSFVANVGLSCEAVLADASDSDLPHAAMRDVKVDNSKVKISGDTATIPNDAVTFRRSILQGGGTIHLIGRGGPLPCKLTAPTNIGWEQTK